MIVASYPFGSRGARLNENARVIPFPTFAANSDWLNRLDEMSEVQDQELMTMSRLTVGLQRITGSEIAQERSLQDYGATLYQRLRRHL